ncbi:MAG: arginine--tRNA ligase [Candidatus Methanomethylicia archaeon]|nr:arginine--tRNA ligase [Candidatus Methanomethylicia archaeon]MCX8168890.1 arginine--tRNA ligase [Candidatus Methanomethylicia archaeon]MDW7988622.1 arginine--tRNA ligase [Nitrososphaerota archaeon]
MTSHNPFGAFKIECTNAISKALSELGYPTPTINIFLEYPPSNIEADIAFPTFNIAKSLNLNPIELAYSITSKIDTSKFELVSSVNAISGYVNFKVNYPKLAYLTFNAIESLGDMYGSIQIDKVLRIVVEHTSANPIHPLHIGAGRNAILGDSLARLLRFIGHKVRTHFYIDDVGLQVAIATYGYMGVKDKVKCNMKSDHFVGLIYAITNCLVEIKHLKNRLASLKAFPNPDVNEIAKLNSELSEWVSIANELRERNTVLFDVLANYVDLDPDPITSINKLDLDYERGSSYVKSVVRELCTMVIDGFKESLSKFNIHHEFWDWESDVVWSGDVYTVLDKLKKSGFVKYDDVMVFDVESVCRKLGLKKILNIVESHEIPKLTLTRSDGRTLYTTRDIAYTLRQFKDADMVIHVIGNEQSLAQLQLRVALACMGFIDYALNLIHYSYELVHLPGFKMSSRRGRYVDLDSLFEEAVKRCEIEVSKRNPNLSVSDVRNIAEIVAVGAIRYAILSVSPNKRIIFDWNKALDFNQNSGPFIQYAHARAYNILAKVDWDYSDYDVYKLMNPLEHKLIVDVAKFPEVISETISKLSFESLCVYLNNLAMDFNLFYDNLPVLRCEDRGLRNARIMLVKSVMKTLKNGLSILGIEAPKRM